MIEEFNGRYNESDDDDIFHSIECAVEIVSNRLLIESIDDLMRFEWGTRGTFEQLN